MSYKDVLRNAGITPQSEVNNPNPEGEGAGGEGGAAGGEGSSEGGSTDGDQSGGTDSEIDLEDEKVIKALQKKGINVSSIEDLKPKPTAEQQAEAARLAREAARSYGLNKQLVTSTVLEQYDRDAQDKPENLAYQVWKAEQLEDQKNLPEDERLSEDELLEEFKTEFYLFADEDDKKRLKAGKQLQAMANSYLQEKYGNVLSLNDEYNAHVEEQSLRTSYNTNLDAAFTEVGNAIPFTIKEGNDEFTYNFALLPKHLSAAKEKLISDDSFAVFGKSKLSKTDLINTIKAGVTQANLNEIIASVATAHASARVMQEGKGRRGIPDKETGTHQRSSASDSETPIMKRILANAKKA